MDDKICYNVPQFNGRNVPVKEVARLMGKDQQFIKQTKNTRDFSHEMNWCE